MHPTDPYVEVLMSIRKTVATLPLEASPAVSWGAGAAVALLCAGALIGPVALGGTGPWARLGLEVCMAGAAMLWAASAQSPTRVMALALAATGAAILQIAPLPDRLLVSLAPISAGAWKVAHEGLFGAHGSISVDPGATAAAGRRLLLGLATIAVVADLGRQAIYRRWLARAVAAAGVVILALGLLFPVSSQDRVVLGFVDLKGPIDYWLTPLRPRVQTAGFGYPAIVTVADQTFTIDEGGIGDGFGSYIVSNHFVGGLCLALPMALAAWLTWSGRRMPMTAAYGGFVAAILAALWVSGGMASSRAGAVALGFAGLALLALTLRTGRARRIGIAAVAMYAVGILCLLAVLWGWVPGIVDMAPAALKEKTLAILRDPRVDAAKVAMRVFFAAPLLGTGLSTFGDIYPRFAPGKQIMYFAHNDYAQLLAETGLVGAGFALAFGWMLLQRLRGFLAKPAGPDWLLGAGAWAGVAGIAAHSAFDWNLHVPANAFLAAILGGLAAASGASVPASTKQASPPRRGALHSGTMVLFITACGASLLLLGRDASSERSEAGLRRAITAARIAAKDPGRPSAAPRVADAVAAGERAAWLDPANAHLAASIAQGSLLLSAEPQPIEQSDVFRRAAEQWADKARLHCATCRGLPSRALQPTVK